MNLAQDIPWTDRPTVCKALHQHLRAVLAVDSPPTPPQITAHWDQTMGAIRVLCELVTEQESALLLEVYTWLASYRQQTTLNLGWPKALPKRMGELGLRLTRAQLQAHLDEPLHPLRHWSDWTGLANPDDLKDLLFKRVETCSQEDFERILHPLSLDDEPGHLIPLMPAIIARFERHHRPTNAVETAFADRWSHIPRLERVRIRKHVQALAQGLKHPPHQDPPLLELRALQAHPELIPGLVARFGLLLDDLSAAMGSDKALINALKEAITAVAKHHNANNIAFEHLQNHMDQGKALTATVLHNVKGGFKVCLGATTGFLPASQLHNTRIPPSQRDQWIGRQLACALLKVNAPCCAVVVSHRAWLQDPNSPPPTPLPIPAHDDILPHTDARLNTATLRRIMALTKLLPEVRAHLEDTLNQNADHPITLRLLFDAWHHRCPKDALTWALSRPDITTACVHRCRLRSYVEGPWDERRQQDTLAALRRDTHHLVVRTAIRALRRRPKVTASMEEALRAWSCRLQDRFPEAIRAQSLLLQHGLAPEAAQHLRTIATDPTTDHTPSQRATAWSWLIHAAPEDHMDLIRAALHSPPSLLGDQRLDAAERSATYLAQCPTKDARALLLKAALNPSAPMPPLELLHAHPTES